MWENLNVKMREKIINGTDYVTAEHGRDFHGRKCTCTKSMKDTI